MNCFPRFSRSKNKDTPANQVNAPNQYQPTQASNLNQPPNYGNYEVRNQYDNYNQPSNTGGGFFLGDQVTYNNPPSVQGYTQYGTNNQNVPTQQNQGYQNQMIYTQPVNQPYSYQVPQTQTTTYQYNQSSQSSNPTFNEQKNNWGQQKQWNEEQPKGNNQPEVLNQVGWGLIQNNSSFDRGNEKHAQQITQSIISKFEVQEKGMGDDTNHAIQYKKNSSNIWTEAMSTMPANINSQFQKLSQMGGGYRHSIEEQQMHVKEGFPSPFIKYKIIPLKDQKKALDVVSVNDRSRGLYKNNMTIWDYHGGPNQLFYIAEHRKYSGQYFIFNISRGFVVQIPQFQTPNFKKGQLEPVVARPRTADILKQNQLWTLEQADYGTYVIRSKQNGKVLDLYYQRSDNGTPVIHWDCSGKPASNQKWRIVPA